MINFYFRIVNPWYTENFATIFSRSGSFARYKCWEFEIIRYSYDLVELSFMVKTHQDHSGVSLALGLLGYTANITVYDNRHWDCGNKKWIT